MAVGVGNFLKTQFTGDFICQGYLSRITVKVGRLSIQVSFQRSLGDLTLIPDD